MRLYRVLLLFSVAFAVLSGFAAKISVFDAECASRAFAQDGRHLVPGLASFPREVREHSSADNSKFFSVRMSGGGTLFLSGDDQFEPIIAFSSSSIDFDKVDKNSPLYALLYTDARVRRATAAAKQKWTRLISRGDALTAYPSMLSLISLSSSLSSPGDIRVDALVKSKWGQDVAGGENCYNLYTPDNRVCGCVATAMSQVMRYHRWPDTEHPVTATTFQCGYGPDLKNYSVTNLTMQGGIYDWSSMPLATSADPVTSVEHRQAIGKLTSDAGISVRMIYTVADGGATYDAYVPDALMDVWRFAQATYLCDFYDEKYGYINGNHGEDERRRVLQSTMFSNFDNGYPVMLGISGQGGHSIVADGYGYDSGTDYVHLNMGWSGSDDLWYNLPAIGTGYNFNSVDDVIYNIFPTNGTDFAALSGRVIDVDSHGVSAAHITIYRGGTSEVVAELESSATGVYGAILSGGTNYDIVAVSEDLALTGVLSKVSLSLPNAHPQWEGACSRVVYANESIGNSWGNDILLAPDIRTIPTNFYVSASSGVDAPESGTFDAPYATIQYAITNGQHLVNGDVINVFPGTYYGCVETPETSISIISTDGPDATAIDGQGCGCCYRGTANQRNLLSGFIITNGADYGGIYYGTATNCVILNCENFKYGYGGGAYGAYLSGCVLHNNESYYGGGAAFCTLVNCTVYDNWAAYDGGGVDCDCVLTNSIVWRNTVTSDYTENNWERYQYGWTTYKPSFAYSCTYPAGFTDLGGNITNDPKCVSFDIDDWRLRSGSPCVGTGLGGLNMGAWQGDPLVGYVITAEVNGRGSVSPWAQLVLPGSNAIFTAVGDHPFLGFETNGIFVSSERVYVWPNVWSDDILTANFGVTNYFIDAATGNDTNDGLSWGSPLRTIYAMTQKAGRGDKVKVGPGNYPGCDWCIYGVEVESTDGASATVIDGGGANRCIYADQMVYRGFTFCNGKVTNENGYGGGALYGTFIDCVFSNCTATYGGAVAGSVLTNCLVVGNSAERYKYGGGWSGGYGGGAYECELVNCTLSGNVAYYYGGGAFLHSSGEARNTIVSGNASTSGNNYGNDVYGNHYWSMSNSFSDVDVKFRDAVHGDYRLTPSSPAVDAGSVDFVSVDHDLARTNRVWGQSVDAGCYEYHLPAGVSDPSIVGVANALSLEGYRGEYAAAVTTPKDYAYLVEWTAKHGLSSSDLNGSSTGFISPALAADGLLALDSTNIVLQTFTSASDGVWSVALSLPGYDRSRINVPLLKAAIGIVGSSELEGSYSADDLSLVVTPSMSNIVVTVTPPVTSNYFMKATVR